MGGLVFDDMVSWYGTGWGILRSSGFLSKEIHIIDHSL